MKALVLIGSRVRNETDLVWQADAHSDWDFQIVASRTEIFKTSAWAKTLGLNLRTYCLRSAAIGGVPKVAALFGEEECDFVVLPAGLMSLSRVAVRLGLHRRSDYVRRKLQDLAMIVRPGWRFLKGGQKMGSVLSTSCF